MHIQSAELRQNIRKPVQLHVWWHINQWQWKTLPDGSNGRDVKKPYRKFLLPTTFFTHWLTFFSTSSSTFAPMHTHYVLDLVYSRSDGLCWSAGTPSYSTRTALPWEVLFKLLAMIHRLPNTLWHHQKQQSVYTVTIGNFIVTKTKHASHN